jgi:hypothetical protein
MEYDAMTGGKVFCEIMGNEAVIKLVIIGVQHDPKKSDENDGAC